MISFGCHHGVQKRQLQEILAMGWGSTSCLVRHEGSKMNYDTAVNCATSERITASGGKSSVVVLLRRLLLQCRSWSM